MTKTANILYNDLTEGDLYLKEDQMNLLLETEEENSSNINSNEDKEEINEKKEEKGNFINVCLKSKNFILKDEFFKRTKDKEEKYTNIKDMGCLSIINYYLNNNFIQTNINENDAININKELKEKYLQENIDKSESKNNINKSNEIIIQNLSDKDLNKTLQNNSNNKISDNLVKKQNKNYNIIDNICNNSLNNDQLNYPLINNIFNIIKTNNYFYSNKNISTTNAHNTIILKIKDKYGCMVMKNKILSEPNYANEILFPQIKNDLVDLSCHNYGNYFLQEFLDIISFENLNTFLDLISKDFIKISISPHGTRVIQKLIDKISFIPILINKFIYIINTKDLSIICQSQYGNHIIQKFLLTFHSCEYTLFIYKFVFQNFINITNSKHGVFIVQKSISEGDTNDREKLYNLILDNLLEIIQNEYGNYLIQFLLLNKKDIENTFQEILPIILKIEEYLLDLCISKYSANAIERCFEYSDNLIRNHILNSLFENHDNKIVDIFFNKYGFYVILKAAKTQNGKYKSKIIDLLNKNNNEVKSNIISKKRNYKNILKIIRDDKDLNDLYKILEDKFINENI